MCVVYDGFYDSPFLVYCSLSNFGGRILLPVDMIPFCGEGREASKTVCCVLPVRKVDIQIERGEGQMYTYTHIALQKCNGL